MALIKYHHNQYAPASYSNIVDRFFNENFFSGEVSNNFTPTVDVIETDKQFEIRFSIPGVDKDHINIDLDKGKLTVSGERKMEEKTEKRNYRTVETRYGAFSRSFYLPENINEDKIEADHKNGVLNVVIPKEEAKSTVRNIAIK